MGTLSFFFGVAWSFVFALDVPLTYLLSGPRTVAKPKKFYPPGFEPGT
jgi:hypothetical protein